MIALERAVKKQGLSTVHFNRRSKNASDSKKIL